jgi:glycosyltransferase involved in cell wall biosynthesis
MARCAWRLLFSALIYYKKMAKQPLISVIVPVYNAEKYLARCIESILAQTYGTLEVILVDDGSADRSGAICDYYAAQDNRVRVIHKANAGVSAARNDGIEASTGEYIAFCDNDDFYAPGMLRRLLEMCVDNDCALAQCLCDRGLADKLAHSSPEPVRVFDSRRMLENFYTEATLFIWDKLYRREVWREVRFPVGSCIAEDDAVVHHLLWAAGRVAVTREKLYYHYRNPECVVNSGFNVRWATDALADRLAFARQNDLPRLAADTLAQMVYEQKYFLVLNRHYTKDPRVRAEFDETHTALFHRYYREAMHTAGMSFKNRLVMSACRFVPFVYNLYNYLKVRVVRGNRRARWAELR